MDQIERIQQMEKTFDSAANALARFDTALNEFEEAQDSFFALSNYYGSEQWFEDVDAHAAGAFPADLKCGVLGEDLPYETLVGYRRLCIRMLEVATCALKRI